MHEETKKNVVCKEIARKMAPSLVCLKETNSHIRPENAYP